MKARRSAIAALLLVAAMPSAQAEPLVLGLGALPAGYVAGVRAAAGRGLRIVKPEAGRWDLAQLDPVALQARCAAGSLQHLDWARLGGRQRFLPLAASDCGAGAFLRATVLAWDKAKVAGSPGWGDFWDVVRRPGRRGLPAGPVGTLEIALMADGVAPGDVYDVLRGRDGVARAFRKLDQLKPYVVWWSDPQRALAIIASGQVAMGAAPFDQVAAGLHAHRGYGVQWDGCLVSVQSWAIATPGRQLAKAGAAKAGAAKAGALVAQVTEPGRAEKLLAGTGFGSALIADAPAATTAGAWPAGVLDRAVPFDAGFWRDNQAALTREFADWLQR